MDTTSVVGTIAGRVERELERVRAARPALSSRVSRAEGIIVAHLSCRRQRVIRVRVAGACARFLVSGSKGAVYVVDPATRGSALARMPTGGARVASTPWLAGRCGGLRPARPPTGISWRMNMVSHKRGSYEERDCVACLSGLVYDRRAGGWVCCAACSGTGRVATFVYPKVGSGGAAPGVRLLPPALRGTGSHARSRRGSQHVLRGRRAMPTMRPPARRSLGRRLRPGSFGAPAFQV